MTDVIDMFSGKVTKTEEEDSELTPEEVSDIINTALNDHGITDIVLMGLSPENGMLLISTIPQVSTVNLLLDRAKMRILDPIEE